MTCLQVNESVSEEDVCQVRAATKNVKKNTRIVIFVTKFLKYGMTRDEAELNLCQYGVPWHLF